MPTVVRLRDARARAVLAAAVAASAASACLPSKDLADYYADGVGGTSAENTPVPSGTDPGAAAADAGATLPASNPEVTPPAPPLDNSDVKVGESSAGETTEPDVEPSDGGVTSEPPADAAPLGPCAAGEVLGSNEHCYFFDARTVAWDAARDACRARGAGWDLASVRSAADSAFLAEAMTFEAWIGATDADDEGTWIWIADGQNFWLGNGTTGAPVGGAYTNWNATEPNGANTTNCARALPASFAPNAIWADLACTALLGAICEQFPVP